MSGRLILLGAGDFAREVIWLISEMAATPEWTLAGLLDDDPGRAASVLRSTGFDQRVLGTILDYAPQPEDRFVCTIAKPKHKLDIAERIAGRGGKFVNLIHPTAAIGPRCTLGRGIIACRNVVVTTNVSLGDHVHLNVGSACGHDATIDDGCTFSGYCVAAGHAVLQRGAFLGTHASVMPGVRVGEFATLGAGSVAFREIPSGETWVGVPARALIERFG